MCTEIEDKLFTCKELNRHRSIKILSSRDPRFTLLIRDQRLVCTAFIWEQALLWGPRRFAKFLHAACLLCCANHCPPSSYLCKNFYLHYRRMRVIYFPSSIKILCQMFGKTLQHDQCSLDQKWVIDIINHKQWKRTRQPDTRLLGTIADIS